MRTLVVPCSHPPWSHRFLAAAVGSKNNAPLWIQGGHINQSLIVFDRGSAGYYSPTGWPERYTTPKGRKNIASCLLRGGNKNMIYLYILHSVFPLAEFPLFQIACPLISVL